MNRVAKLLRGETVQTGDVVTLARPTPGQEHESPGFHPWLDRLVGTTLTVREVAQGQGYTLVLVHETIVPIRGDWLRRI